MAVALLFLWPVPALVAGVLLTPVFDPWHDAGLGAALMMGVLLGEIAGSILIARQVFRWIGPDWYGPLRWWCGVWIAVAHLLVVWGLLIVVAPYLIYVPA